MCEVTHVVQQYRGPLIPRSDTTWVIPKEYKAGMRVEGIIYADESLIDSVLQDEATGQVANVACLPGIVKASMAMPDIHWGYGFAIGGVAAMRLDDGVIVPGGIGYDINCGVRLLRSSLTEGIVRTRTKEIADALFQATPCGVGSKGSIRLQASSMERVLLEGAAWAVANGHGADRDLAFCEEGGHIRDVETGAVSDKARKRGAGQLGTLGSGNHFIEVDVVEEVLQPEIAEVFRLEQGMVVIQIHSGSRGLGHQVCTDYLRIMAQAVRRYDIDIPDQQLACVPIGSIEGQQYLAAMGCAANFAWANRQCLSHAVRQTLLQVFKASPEALGLDLVYDVAHNIARIESHEVDGCSVQLCVHRKGATRAFGPGHQSLPSEYRAVGQPVLVPGDMGRKSYILAGTDRAMRETFGSTCHGAGRLLSRTQAKKTRSASEVRNDLESQGIRVRAGSDVSLAEEAPEAYKDVVSVVDVVTKAGLSLPVAALRPMVVIKG